MNTAARSVKDFWAPFKEAEKHQRKVDDFFKNLKKQIAEVKKESGGLALPGLAPATRPGMPALPGGSGAVQNGGDSRFGQARAAFGAGRGQGQGPEQLQLFDGSKYNRPTSQPRGTLNMKGLGFGAAGMMIGGGLANFADRREP